MEKHSSVLSRSLLFFCLFLTRVPVIDIVWMDELMLDMVSVGE